jgi:hypothetical protein
MARTLLWYRTLAPSEYMSKNKMNGGGERHTYCIKKGKYRSTWWTLTIRAPGSREFNLVNHHETLTAAKEAAQRHIERYYPEEL